MFEWYIRKPCFEVTLPFPPSVNSCYVNAGKKRIKSKSYNYWLSIAKRSFIEQKGLINFTNKISSPYAALYLFNRPDNRIRDCANYEKTLTDFLVKMNVLIDDSKINCNVQCWSGKRGNTVNCKIYSLTE